MKPVYCLHPGHVCDQGGLNPRYVNALDLAQLYGVEMEECVVAVEPRAFDRAASYRRDPYAGLIQLYPRHDGNYVLPAR